MQFWHKNWPSFGPKWFDHMTFPFLNWSNGSPAVESHCPHRCHRTASSSTCTRRPLWNRLWQNYLQGTGHKRSSSVVLCCSCIMYYFSVSWRYMFIKWVATFGILRGQEADGIDVTRLCHHCKWAVETQCLLAAKALQNSTTSMFEDHKKMGTSLITVLKK